VPWYNEALHLLNEGDEKKGMEFLKKAVEIDPSFPTPYGQLAYLHQEHAIAMWGNLLNTLPSSHPGREQAQQMMGSLLQLTPDRPIVGTARTRSPTDNSVMGG
jgi:Tfp pilus assembly protein PilF